MTTRAQFLADHDVSAFIAWLTGSASGHTTGPALTNTLIVDLNIKASPKVPQGLSVSVIGLDAVTALYQWKANWQIPPNPSILSQDWQSTRNSLASLSAALRGPVLALNNGSTLVACDAILRWGGDRSRARGAYPFLHGLADPSGYICTAAAQLSLATADLAVLGNISKMNSMLTKVHALDATDGLPIYDSRVAVAIATLVEIYRSCRTPGWTSVPALLTFPSLDPARAVTSLFTGALDHGSLAARDSGTTVPWTQSKIRLGWIIEDVLTRQPNLFSDDTLGGGSLQGRMHAFEAALFMIGYDARCLSRNFCNPPKGGVVLPAKARIAATARKSNASSTSNKKTACTLTSGTRFGYVGNREDRLRIDIGKKTSIDISAAFIDEIVAHFADAEWVDGDFSRGPAGQRRAPDESFASFIEEHSENMAGRRLSRQNAPRIAAVLVAIGVCQSRKKGRATQLNFNVSAD